MRKLGRYTLHEEIGRGGMAEIYRAMLEGPMGYSKEVAVKLVPARLTEDESNVHALVNEARIGGQLRHPNIVEVYDLDCVDGDWFVAMELVKGKTLGELLKKCRQTDTPLPLSVILDAALGVAEGLHYAHTFRTSDGKKAGLIHRDLKPGNVMIGDRGEVKVMDFGIARSSLNYYLTTAGSPVRGTPLYMSPEQFDGGELTPASDIFAFGAMLYEMVTNERLFLASDVRMIVAAVMFNDMTPALDRVAARDEGLAGLVGRCLERDVDARLRSSRKLYEALVELREAESEDLTLAEFVSYLQQVEEIPSVRRADDNTWSWTTTMGSRSASFDPDEEMEISLRRPMEEVAAQLDGFGRGFFGPIRHPNPDEEQLRRREGGGRMTPADATAGPDVDTGRPTSEGGAPLAGPVSQTLDRVGETADRSTNEAKVPPAPTGPEEAPPEAATVPQMSSAPFLDAQPIGPPVEEAPAGRSYNPLLVVLPLLGVAAVLAVLLIWLIQPPRLDAATALATFDDALVRGDSAAASEALRQLDPATADTPAGRVLRATAFAIEGDGDLARDGLGDPESLPDPYRSRGHALLGGLASVEAADGWRTEAAAAYARALTCRGDGCEGVLRQARHGLAAACDGADPRPPSCGEGP